MATKSPIRLLLVEDNPGDVRLVSELLLESGGGAFRMKCVESLATAIEELAEGGVDVVLLDLSLPDSTGLDTFLSLHAHAPDVPVVVLTGLSDQDTATAAIQAGAQDYLAKDRADGGALTHAVRFALERKRAERAESERNRLRESVAAMEQVLGVVGHELRAPLSAMQAVVEFLVADTDRKSPKYDTFLRSLRGEVVRMADTVGNLLEAARLDSGVARWNWSMVQLGEVCRQARQSLEPLVRDTDVQLAFDVDPTEARMRGDGDAIRRMIVNLVSSALTHTERGKVCVGVRALNGKTPPRVQIQVSDTGGGMPSETVTQLGEAFGVNAGVIGSSRLGGCGLGLAICKGIAAAHAGELHVQSRLNEGTTITAVLRADLPGPMSRGARK